MNSRMQPGPTLMPGDPRYEGIAEEIALIVDGNFPRGVIPRFIHPLANLLPMMVQQHRSSFRASLAIQQNHPCVLHLGKLLDGRNRARELIELKKPISTVVFVGSDHDALDFVNDENFERRHLNESQRADYAARVVTMRLGANQHTKAAAQICAPSLPLEDVAPDAAPAEGPMMSTSEAAEKFNVSRRLVQHAVSYQQKGIPELSDAVRAGDMAASVASEIAERPVEQQKAILEALPRDDKGKLTTEAKKALAPVIKEVRAEKQVEKKKKRAAKEAQLGAKIRALPDVKAGLILSDFEWHFKVRNEETGMDRHAANHYVTAKEAYTPEAIVERQRERMKVAADDNIHLMWCPASFLAIAIKVMELQGYTYVSQFVWIKDRIGTGFWVRDKHECLLIGVKGKIPCPAMGDQFNSAIEAPKGEHSEKPDFQYEIAEHYFPSLPKIELNARRFREGWIQWGNEAPEPAQASLGIDSGEEAS